MGASKADFVSVFQLCFTDTFAVDECAVAAAQIIKRVFVRFGDDAGIGFGNGWVFDDEGVVERAPDQDFVFVENIGDALFAFGKDSDEVQAGV